MYCFGLAVCERECIALVLLCERESAGECIALVLLCVRESAGECIALVLLCVRESALLWSFCV